MNDRTVMVPGVEDGHISKSMVCGPPGSRVKFTAQYLRAAVTVYSSHVLGFFVTYLPDSSWRSTRTSFASLWARFTVTARSFPTMES